MLPEVSILILWIIPLLIFFRFLRRMFGDLKTRYKYMGIKNIFILSLIISLVSCREKVTNNIFNSRPGKNEMADLNKYLVQKDRERIRNYIERKSLKMYESPTGLWYQIKNEGTGKNFVDND